MKPPPPATLPCLLFVDDEEVIIELVRDILDDESFQLVTATDGAQALAALREHGERVFMAIVDLTMPEMKDWKLVETLAQENPRVPIHVAVGYDTDESNIPAALDERVAGLVRKPLRVGPLLEIVETTLSG